MVITDTEKKPHKCIDNRVTEIKKRRVDIDCKTQLLAIGRVQGAKYKWLRQINASTELCMGDGRKSHSEIQKLIQMCKIFLEIECQ